MRRWLVLLSLAVALVLGACSGSDGAQGPEGPAGPAGPVGPVGPAGPAGDGVALAAEWVGSDTCAGCHSEIADVFNKSGHPYKLNKVVDGQPPEYPFTEVPNPPEGVSWDDVAYVIGGYNWKARFVGLDGFIITGDADSTTQYNLFNAELGLGDNWVPYHPGEEKPYNCGTCHTSGYQPEGNQDGLPGLIGTWAETGIVCEECHGPGSNHITDPYAIPMTIDRSAESCGSCHSRGAVESINASGGFVKHHEQYEELFQSKHRVLDCVDCHDPHEGVVQARKAGTDTVRAPCESCHFEEAKFQASEAMKAGLDCIDCHMPRIVKSALADAEAFTGDIRAHLWAIDPFAVSQFTEEGDVAISQITLDFACKSCHRDGGTASIRSDDELVEEAVDYHARP